MVHCAVMPCREAPALLSLLRAQLRNVMHFFCDTSIHGWIEIYIENWNLNSFGIALNFEVPSFNFEVIYPCGKEMVCHVLIGLNLLVSSFLCKDFEF